jgi:KipI family sensor histidine kinase inhibitor
LASDHSLLVRFGEAMDPALHEGVRTLFESLIARPVSGVVNLHPAYASLLVDFEPLATTVDDLIAVVRARLGAAMELPESRLVEIPVRYDGPDLDDVASHCGLSAAEVIARHTAPEYLTYFLGFSPGFPYLGGMDPLISMPRLSTPRTEVPGGSVGIAGGQTGVYPLSSPGGWRLIGRTELRLFDPAREPASLVRMGDRVRFVEA